ncbi:recombination endonuclease subunit [Synechococcus phage S-PM2]|uniref:Recombination endonuclease subunit n=1 Tax=Synechococcus phage S-PM2 TaxID=238854 RepID=Q5GQM2_BPSYP|nr:SbcD-like subunit of palindrome specific endonuclease [Synechococcus phage S-PM2]CAF34180.1 recombination endonuclease subunit [Synechococcus phage S-PM2]CFW42286.1 recombination endonuclease subunit [Synechococcus phage S-PM2]
MTIALITDQHLDGRKGSLAFWNYFEKFYDDVFFSTLKERGISTVIDLGDTFDNRKNIDFNVWNRVRSSYFDRLHSMGIKLHMILGNHCIYYKNTNKINSPELLLGEYDNVTIYANPTTVDIEGVKVCMLPWINKENQQETMDHLQSTDAEIVMGHLELNGFVVTPGMTMDHGMDPIIFKNFKQVFSGHFHHKSTKGNITYLGNPYQMFWNDYKDKRGFHLYEPKSNKLTRILNPYEIFEKIYYNDIENDYSEFDGTQYKDKYVKLVVVEKTDYHQFEKVMESLYDSGIHDLKIVETLLEDDTTEIDENIEIKDTMTLLNEYIDEVEMSVSKSDLKNLMKSLYIESCEVV